jgi:hypothetical protein
MFPSSKITVDFRDVSLEIDRRAILSELNLIIRHTYIGIITYWHYYCRSIREAAKGMGMKNY